MRNLEIKVGGYFSRIREAIIVALKACAISHIIMTYRHTDTLPPSYTMKSLKVNESQLMCLMFQIE
jgi:hypothetical protein